jgi:hypothetical protein
MNDFRKMLTFNHLSGRDRLRPEREVVTESAWIGLLKGSLVVLSSKDQATTGLAIRLASSDMPRNSVWLIFIIGIILNNPSIACHRHYNGLVQ